MKFFHRKIRRYSRLIILLVLTIFTVWVYFLFHLLIEKINITNNWCTNYQLNDNISCGEESLITETARGGFTDFNEGLQNFKAGKWEDAVKSFEKQRNNKNRQNNNKNNPEILIYLNNAELTHKPRKTTYTIAVAVPAVPIKVAEVFLRGVAQVQEKFNNQNEKLDLGLKVLIVNDENDPLKVATLADNLISKNDVVAVIGHYASEVTKAALPVYQRKEIVLISAGSTAMRAAIVNGGNYPKNFFFRTVPNVKLTSSVLFNNFQLSQLANGEKVAVFYNPNSTYSKSAFDQFRQQLGDNKIIDVDISNPTFIPINSLIDVKKQGAKVLILIPDGHVNSHSFKNALSLINLNADELPIGGYSVLYDLDILTDININMVKKLVLVIPWHRSTSPNQEVINDAKNLWGTGDINDKTAMSYDAALVLTEALKKLDTNHDFKKQRLEIQKQLTGLQVTAGASGNISFDSNGDRKEEIYELVKVVPVQSSKYRAMFIPINNVTKY